MKFVWLTVFGFINNVFDAHDPATRCLDSRDPFSVIPL
jgi:hypothetical protein